MSPHSFDPTRKRVVPTSIEYYREERAATISFKRTTLVVAVKTDCMGCRDFVHSNLTKFDAIDIVIISTNGDAEGEWRGAPNEVMLVSEDVLAAFDIRWPPFYVLVNHLTGDVLVEGLVFGPSQVLEEISSFLS